MTSQACSHQLTTEIVQQNLDKAEITLPVSATSVANYVGYVCVGRMVIISGQLPIKDGFIAYREIVKNTEISLENGYKAARLCGINILAQLNDAIEGDWSRVKRCVRLGGLVTSAGDFTDHPKIVNGASDLMVEILGECGRHARVAIGVSSLPLGASVEVEALFELHG